MNGARRSSTHWDKHNAIMSLINQKVTRVNQSGGKDKLAN